MSIKELTLSGTEDQQWSAIYPYSVNTNSVVATNATIDNVTINAGGTISTFDLVVTNDAIINSNNFNVTNGQGVNGQVLTTDGAGHVQWTSNGAGNVMGPISSGAGDIVTFADTTGQLIQDSLVNISDILVNPLTADLNANAYVINDTEGVVIRDISLISLPTVPGSNKIYSSQSDGKLRVVSDIGIGGRIAINSENMEANELKVNYGGPNEYKMALTQGNPYSVLTADGLGGTYFNQQYQGNGIIYRPGGVSNANVYATWPEIVTVVQNSNQCLSIYIDDSLISPAVINQPLDCKGRVTFRPYKESVSSPPTMRFQQDIQITDPAAFYGIANIIGNTSSNSNIVLSDAAFLKFFEGANLTNDPASTLPIIHIADGNGAVMAFQFGSRLETTNAVPIVNVGVGSTLIIAQFDMTVPFGNDTISSTDGSATLLREQDASGTNFTNVGYTGSDIPLYVDQAAGVVYDDSVLPALGSTNVQGAIDALKVKVPGYALNFGGNLTGGFFIANFNGQADSVAGAGISVVSNAIAPISGNVTSWSYNTTGGDATSNVAVRVNGVEYGFILTGPVGVHSGISVPVLAGQEVGIDWVSGTDPGISNFSVFVAT